MDRAHCRHCSTRSGSWARTSSVKAEILDQFLKDSSAARKLVADMVKGDHVERLSDILHIIKANQASLLAADRSFILEIQLLKFAPTALEETVKKRLLGILPSETKDISLKQVLWEIQALKQSDLVKKSSNSSKGQLAAFEEIVANMIRGISRDHGPAMTCSYYGQFSKFQICFCGLGPGNLKFETVRTDKQHICF